MPVRQQAQHRGVIDRGDPPQPVVAQRHDRGGPGVVRVGLVGAARVEQPDPCRQGRRHVEHRLAGGDELLGQQRAEPAGRLDRPGAGREAAANASSRSRCRRSALTRSSPTTVSVPSSTAAVWDPLWGSIPMMNTTPSSWLSQW